MSTEKINNYIYVLAVAKRARQLLKGEKPLISCEDYHPIKVAKKEIDSGLVVPFIPREVMDRIQSKEETSEETEEE